MDVEIHILIPNPKLMERDEKITDKYWPYGVQVVYKSSLADLLNRPNDILIVDEADDLIKSQPHLFHQKTSKCRCLCFSATNAAGDEFGSKVFQKLGFQINCYGKGMQL